MCGTSIDQSICRGAAVGISSGNRTELLDEIFDGAVLVPYNYPILLQQVQVFCYQNSLVSGYPVAVVVVEADMRGCLVVPIVRKKSRRLEFVRRSFCEGNVFGYGVHSMLYHK